MRRADRLFQIVQRLSGGRRTTAGELARTLEVSQRTIYRDIADLQASGVPIEGEAGFGYVMLDGFHLPPMMFTEGEVVALVAGARMLRAFGGAEMALAAEEALIKIAAVLPEAARAQADKVQIYALPGAGADPKTRAMLDLLSEATGARLRLVLDYADGAGQATQRRVRPLGLWYWGRVWTLVAWCELRDDFRMFRVDRIASAEASGSFREERGKRLSDFYAAEVEAGRGPHAAETKGPS